MNIVTKRHNAKYKVDRKLGVNLWGRAKSPYNLRTSRPGQHGDKPRSMSDYAKQFMAKQKIKLYYANISEKRFRRYAQEATRVKGDSSENLIGFLETRLDAVVYRMKFVPTMFASRQFINHGHVLVNGKKVNIASYSVKVGDEVSVKSSSKDIPFILSSLVDAERDIPDYIEVETKALQGKFLNIPTLSNVPYPFVADPAVVIAFYSR